MKTLMNASVFGLVAVPPAPDPVLSQGPSPPMVELDTQKLVGYPNRSWKSLKALVAASVLGIALTSIAMVFVSVHATSAPPAVGASAPAKSLADSPSTHPGKVGH